MSEVKPTRKTRTICCEQMLMEIGESIYLNSFQWPHLRNAITGPSLDACPWCGEKLPFPSKEVKS